MEIIENILLEFRDDSYGDFVAKLIPGEERKCFIGVRAPCYKKILRRIDEIEKGKIETFLQELPHKYHEENVLHILLINRMQNYDECIKEFEAFAPFVTNWAVSDSLGPAVFEKNKEKLIIKIEEWIKNGGPFTKRMAMLLIKKYFLDEDFDEEYLEWAAGIRCDEYYVNMMRAWLFAEALVKDWDCALCFLRDKKLDVWTHNKTILKARESFRITDEKKEFLKSLRIKK